MTELNLTPEEIRGLSPEVRKKLGVSNAEISEPVVARNFVETGKILPESSTLKEGGAQPSGVLSKEVKQAIVNKPEGFIDPAIKIVADPKAKMNFLLEKLQNGGDPHDVTEIVTKQSLS